MNGLALRSVAALSAGLLVVIAAELALWGPRTRELPPRYAPTAARAARHRTQPAGSETRIVATILARPLFDRSRRPIAAAGSASGPLRLTGVIVGPSGREAIFQPVQGGKPLVVQVGQTVGPATVRAITPGAVLIVDAGGSHLIEPSYAPVPFGVAPAPVPFAPPRPVPSARPKLPK